MTYETARRHVSSPRKESSAGAASAKRIRQSAPPWLALETTGGLDEDVAYQQRMRAVQHGLPFLDPGAGVPRGRPSAELRHPALSPLDDWLSERAGRVTATAAELAVAEERADAVIAALESIYPDAKVYRTGSIAHGDALSPLNDVDLGVILKDRPDLGPGPSQGRPENEMQRTAAALADKLRPRFPDLTADPSNKRSIVLTFSPQADDFTCDVIIAIPAPSDPLNPGPSSLLIPNTELSAGWDENDPSGHVERLKEADAASGGSFSRTVRLVKHWRSGQSAKPLYSWNIKTLALEAGTDSTLPFEGLYQFFAHAIQSAGEGPTENPGSPNYPPPTVPIDRLEVARQLMDALAALDRARMYALADDPEGAVRELSGLFPEGDAYAS